MVRINYVVHSVEVQDFAVDAVVAGRTVPAKVSGLVIELTSDDASMGHTYRFIPDDGEGEPGSGITAALAEFAVGNVVAAELSGSAPSA